MQAGDTRASGADEPPPSTAGSQPAPEHSAARSLSSLSLDSALPQTDAVFQPVVRKKGRHRGRQGAPVTVTAAAGLAAAPSSEHTLHSGDLDGAGIAGRSPRWPGCKCGQRAVSGTRLPDSRRRTSRVLVYDMWDLMFEGVDERWRATRMASPDLDAADVTEVSLLQSHRLLCEHI